jgi:pyruvate,water dikinase
MSGTEPVVVRGRTFEPPGKGPWEIDSTHSSTPATFLLQDAFTEGMVRGFKEGTARYGLMLSHLQPAYVQSFGYMQPVAVGAPAGAMGPPPKPVLQLLCRVHPELRRRARTAARAIADKVWREDLARWDDVDKPAAIARHRKIQAIDVAALSDVELADHVELCARHLADSIYLHHKYTIAATFPVGDFLAGAHEWTGASVGELLTLLRGRSEISRGFAAEQLDVAAKALTTSDEAQAILHGREPAEDVLQRLAAHPAVGAQVSAYLDAVRWRCVGYDVGDRAAGELPDVLVGALRAALAGVTATPDDDSALAAVRARVPAEHLEDFDDRLAEVRLMYRLRDERGVFGDGWAVGLARRAMLELGRRLAAAGVLEDAEHAVELRPAEARALLLGAATGPSAAEVAERFAWRHSATTSDAPPFLRAQPAPPPPVAWLPRTSRRSAAAMDIFMGNLFGVAETPNSDTVLTGLAVNSGVYEGTARRVESSADFGRIEQGDVLVARMTSPYFNVVLPLLGAIVTDRGGQLSHAAIVAREYGIPGIVGTRDATRLIPDGARVRVDGSTGEVRLLG